ncbi:hypothetical protein BL250_02375 [Erwinia sp. OLTSP20]|uniref:hypothetical protein n=1 Tax=unclassified Erwinia TaxID=2622719 RepID=UPI000C19E254|nr:MULTISPECIES: hypothetical protein [unclassified Erwinia]PIJ48810.1 hypothetical protein BV501_16165 [Erwinia sp. OAMSP11]PIJ69433.1 hypothetical protein BK416_15110 [Erwinia sp. OLSSP12]PIJ79267.1 hypothetical protein BLD47_15415 [Erwinia sp. OLCASP19]PIJ80793.1 hypothetical protein BLD46_14575 [Erwinia sp. OLMTSP26]PIJ82945.1 hypothetical protein BLD49_14470 [Erwinia sp. OLMDSP33]
METEQKSKELSEPESESSIPMLAMKGIPQEILALGSRLADTKYQIDLLGKSGWGCLTANLHGLETSGEWDGPDDALTFFSKIFPFAPQPVNSESMGVFQVPTGRVIGRSWRWWPEHLNANSEARLAAHLSSQHAADSTSYFFIPQLAVVLAVEGQNRVSYCREKQIPNIMARVSKLDYPPADRMRIYHVMRGNTRQSWVVLHDRYLQLLQWPRITLPALATYGVHSHHWPAHFPAVRHIFDELYAPQQLENFLAPCLDLNAIGEKIVRKQEEARLAAQPVSMALTDMPVANIWPISLTTLFIFMLSLLLVGMTMGNGMAGKVSLITAGASASILLFLMTPILVVSRRMRREAVTPYPSEDLSKAPSSGTAEG